MYTYHALCDQCLFNTQSHAFRHPSRHYSCSKLCHNLTCYATEGASVWLISAHLSTDAAVNVLRKVWVGLRVSRTTQEGRESMLAKLAWKKTWNKTEGRNAPCMHYQHAQELISARYTQHKYKNKDLSRLR